MTASERSDIAAAFLPSMAAPWVTAYSAATGYLMLGGAAVLVLLYLGGSLQVRIRDLMRRIWIRRLATEGRFDAVAHSIRTHTLYRIFFYWLKRQGLPTFFAVLGLWIILAFLSQVSFRIADGLGRYCVGSSPSPQTIIVKDRVEFNTKDGFCVPVGGSVKKDEDYRVLLTVAEDWKDNTIDTDPRGFGFKKMSALMYLALPFRRVVFSSWFAPVLRVGSKGGEEHVLDFRLVEGRQYEARFRPHSDGEVFIFVNDAVFGWPGPTKHFYGNNHGTAAVAIEHLTVTSRE